MLVPTCVSAASTDTTELAQTDKGCKFYTYSRYRVTSASWSLPCTAGSFIAGKGTLTFDSRYLKPDSDDLIGLRHSEYRGVFKNGYLEGAGELKRDLMDAEGKLYARVQATGNFVRSEQTGPGKSIREIPDGNGGWRQTQLQDGEFLYDNMHGQVTWTYYPPPGSGYRARIISGQFDAAEARNATVMYTNTWLGGTLTITDPVSFNSDGQIVDTSARLHGTLARSGSRLNVSLPAVTLDNEAKFLRTFNLSTGNWEISCEDISDIRDNYAFVCPGTLAVDTPVFQGEQDWTILLAELDNSVAPLNAMDLRALRDLAAANEAQEQAEQEAEANATFTRDEFVSCIRFSERLEKQSQELEADGEAIDDDETALTWLISLHNAAVSVGGDGSGAGDLNARQRQHHNWVERHNRQADALNENVSRYKDQCLIEDASMPHAIVSELCAGSDSDFCRAWN
ncbi:hypothetical protein HPT27_02585 [Permianibacter sp. IMCC34836]|uniref:hypothetical protein n=1 Tax=Permianibacter fluminis TaxID=2738515 RepID=UPI001555A972|nr:hypothetical protein [Permianibacter fluminis]NQD35892.1 hypothetical protein [Permianibacter fluminis]